MGADKVGKVKSEKEALLIIRQTLEIFGHDTSDISDEELKEGVTRFTTLVANSGITTDEAMIAMSKLAEIKI